MYSHCHATMQMMVIAYLEELYASHRIVGTIDHNSPQGVMLPDEKK